ncbi:hypothetical protein SAMN05428945_5307 [Streptomyces sp. 2224.1]|nr:hypothetical protein SAMN05428945_5307 [Streptomyces sp. 2224.1]
MAEPVPLSLSPERLEQLGGVVRIMVDQGAGPGACDRKAEEGVDAERRRVTTTRMGVPPRRSGVGECVPGPASPP